MALAPSDLVTTAELAGELLCTRRNVNVAARRFGIQRFNGGRVSRSQFLQAKAHLGNPTQAANSAKASRVNGMSKANGRHASGNGKPAADVGHSQGEEFKRPNGSSVPAGLGSQAEAERIRSWTRLANEQIELGLKKGKLLDREEVAKTFMSIGRMYKSSRQNEPAQLAPLLIGKDVAEMEEILRREGRAADERLANEVIKRFGTIIGLEVKPD